MPSKRGKSAKAGVPKWKREGFPSYRQYLNARYKELGYKTYSEYSARRQRGEVPSTRGVFRPTVAGKELPSVAGLTRLSYESEVPFKYKLGQLRGAALVQWLQHVIADIEARHPPATIFSGAYRLFGKLAIKLDDNGKPVFEPGLKEFWVAHLDWPKMVAELYSIARAFGDHKFEAAGYQIGRAGSRIFALLIQKVRISVIVLSEGQAMPKGPIWRVLKHVKGNTNGK